MTSQIIDGPGADDTLTGQEYTNCIAALVEALPDVRLTVAEHAQNGVVTFVRWIMLATGNLGLFELSGIDCLTLRNGLVAENVIVFDTAVFQALAGRWSHGLRLSVGVSN